MVLHRGQSRMRRVDRRGVRVGRGVRLAGADLDAAAEWARLLTGQADLVLRGAPEVHLHQQREHGTRLRFAAESAPAVHGRRRGEAGGVLGTRHEGRTSLGKEVVTALYFKCACINVH